jgi:transposase
MSTSLLYHAFGIRGYRYVRTEYVGGGVIFTISQDRDLLSCSACDASPVILRGKVERRFVAPPIGGRPVTIVFPVPRVECLSCGVIRQVEIAFAKPRRRHTKSFERYVLELSRLMTISDVSRHLGIGWDLIKEIHKRDLLRRYSKPKLRSLRLLAIDEISLRRGFTLMTVVMDLETGAIVHVIEGRSFKALEPFMLRLRRSGAKIEAVAADFAGGYARAVTTFLPKAALVFDRFHVMQLMNKKLSQFRHEVWREALGKQKTVLKGTRWLLLKNPETLSEERQEPGRLEEALRLNKPLATAYYLKEDLGELWEQENKAAAGAFLTDWIRRANNSGIRMLKTMASTLAAHRAGLLAWYDYPISTGPLEGTNNKIKVMKRRAYGYRDMAFFKLKILALHETRQVLVG